ncbi:hypothetical protein CDAR_520481 [Caerostris darwini]|uniref:Uncharacterized protein n=1 Tax=Caerostris darwini TaxID=1538125 RepID=A0AAV4W864_9ARAC|nr:hypothetical protein CDAR_520481 [Caerostris darwini]
MKLKKVYLKSLTSFYFVKNPPSRYLNDFKFQLQVSISNDPGYLNPLAPGHFIIGTALNNIPKPNLTSDKITLAERWKTTQQLGIMFLKASRNISQWITFDNYEDK